jgi:hypothetical protein
MGKDQGPIDLQMISNSSNPELEKSVAEIMDDSAVNGPSEKPFWGRRFNASGKFMSPP